MRIFLTGASGLVGSAFARASARRGHTVTGIVGNFSGDLPGLSSRRPLDLTDESALSSALLDVFPDAIVNCAAVSEPAAVDQDPARAQTLNVALPAALANAPALRHLHLFNNRLTTLPFTLAWLLPQLLFCVKL